MSDLGNFPEFKARSRFADIGTADWPWVGFDQLMPFCHRCSNASAHRNQSFSGKTAVEQIAP